MYATLFKAIKKAGILPKISDTERAALEAGTVWIDGEFFSGNPDFPKLLSASYPELSEREQAFIDGPVEELFHLVNAWELSNTRRIPKEVWDFMREKGFFGLIIPEEYGGLGFSTLARSAMMMKVTQLGPVGMLAMIPNTLGAAELLIAYGTQEQKDHYLPKLATGEYVPCFALTEPTAGSDAASIKAEGEVFKDSDGEIKVRLNFSKRYITLAPLADVISLATNLHDPENLLGKGEYTGISVILLHKGMDGLEQGNHHLPIFPFDNGPLVGRDVIVPASNIIGGIENAGRGWQMLMEQLSGGRAISLPASGIAASRIAAAAAGTYSMVRQQFGMPIGIMAGVQERVARIAALAYVQEAARVYICAGIDDGHKPPVISALFKEKATEIGRTLVDDGLDVMAGAAVMQGPNNILGGLYRGVPVNITVEGANILTRTLIVFGQGAVRCHPHALDTLNALENDDLEAFTQATKGWTKHIFASLGRNIMRNLTRGRSVRVPVSGPTAQYYRKLAWASSRFAVLTNMALILVGGKLKQRGQLSGRMADALSWMVLGTVTLRRFEAEGRRKEDLPLVHWAMHYILLQIQEAFEGIYTNFNVPVIGWFLRYPGRLWLRLNALSKGPLDRMNKAAAATIQKDADMLQRIALNGMGAPKEDEPGLGRLLHAWRLVMAAQKPTRKVQKALRKKTLKARDIISALPEAVEQNLITEDEAKQIKAAEKARYAAIQVDAFAPEAYYRDELSKEKITPVADK